MLAQLTRAALCTLLLTAPALATTNIQVGDHIVAPDEILTFPVWVTSDSDETLQGVELFMTMDPGGPLITNVDMITGTVFESNNIGVGDFADPMFLTPGRQPAYFIGTVSGTVPTGVVAYVTIDTHGIAPGWYTLALSNDVLGPSAAYNQAGVAGSFTDGLIWIPEPEPEGLVLGLLAIVGFSVTVIRRRTSRSALAS